MADQRTGIGLKPTLDTIARLDRLCDAITARTGAPTRRGTVALAALMAGLRVLEERNRPRRRDEESTGT